MHAKIDVVHIFRSILDIKVNLFRMIVRNKNDTNWMLATQVHIYFAIYDSKTGVDNISWQ